MRPALRRSLAVFAVVASFLVLPTPAAQAAPISVCEITSSRSVLVPGFGAEPESVTDIAVTVSLPGNTGFDFYLLFTGPNGFVREGQALSTGEINVTLSWQQLLNFMVPVYGPIATPLSGTIVASSTVGIEGAKCSVGVTLLPDASPQAPTSVTATPGNGSATVSWTPWAGGELQTFRVTASPGGATCEATFPETSCVVEGLSNGTPYSFTAATITTGGESEPSAPSAPVTPSGTDPGPEPGPGPDPGPSPAPSPDNGGGSGGEAVPVSPRYTG